MKKNVVKKYTVDSVVWLIAGSLFLMSVIIGSMTFRTLEGMQKISDRYSSIIRISAEKVHLASTMNYAVRNRSQSLLTAFGLEDVFDRDEELQRFSRYSLDFVKAKIRFLSLDLDDKEKVLIEKIKEAASIAQPILQRTADSLLVDNLSFEKLRPYFEKGSIMQSRALLALNNLTEWEYQHAKDQQKITNDYAQEVRNQLMQQGILALLVCLLIFFLSVRYVFKKNKQVGQLHKETAEALEHLSNTKEQLIQSEKMASLGGMVAGIAHEINNPSNFISGARKNLVLDVRSFHELLLDMMDEEEKESEAGDLIEITFEGFNKQLSLMDDGLIRIRTIVDSLRIFSRGETSRFEKNDLTQGIESTLTIAKTQFKNRVELSTDYAELPLITCNVSQINQVVMNLVMNASQAMEKSGKIEVVTQHLPPYISIQVIDDGVGMTDEVKNKIFDPFYTTKKVGVGTGMGLAISYEFVRNHNGRIEVYSEIGKGAVFNVFLPDDLNISN